MPREIALLGVYMPALTLVFLFCLVAGWLMDRLLARLGLYQHIWHPSLFRLGLLTFFFCITGLWIYR